MKEEKIVDLRKFYKSKTPPPSQPRYEPRVNKNENKKFAPGFFSFKGLSNLISGKKPENSKIQNDKPVQAIKESIPTNKRADLPELTWSAREYIKKERGPNWYLYAGITIIVLIVIAILTKSPVMAITFCLITAVVYLTADKEPDYINIKLSPKGIHIDNKLYPYNEIKSFWIFYDPPGRKFLSVISQKIYLPVIKIQLENQNPVLIRKYLLRYIAEEEQEESLTDNLAERLKI